MQQGYSRAQTRELMLIAAPTLVLVIFAFWLASRFVEPAPPLQVTITTGSESGAYYGFGLKYAGVLARSGIKLEVQTSKGSVENIDRLKGTASGYDIALVQGGIANHRTLSGVVSLGRVFLEPLWVFYKGERIDRLTQLSGKRIAVGSEGSGTRKLVTDLLEANIISEDNATLLPLSGDEAAQALLEDRADAAFLTFAPEAPVIRSLLKAPNVRLMNFAQGEAYTRMFPFLSKVVLPQGVVDLVANLPNEDVTLVAPQAALVARDSLHPAMAGLLVEAAIEVHGGGGMFHRVHEYPKSQDPEFLMSDDAARIYRSGQPFLRRYLPFWVATFLERSMIMLLPVATVMVPLFKFVPMIYRWRIRNRLAYWYSQLKRLERQLAEDSSPGARMTYSAEIARISDAVRMIPVPYTHSDQHYMLKAAIELVRQRIAVRA